jgi:hypothetical protein
MSNYTPQNNTIHKTVRLSRSLENFYEGEEKSKDSGAFLRRSNEGVPVLRRVGSNSNIVKTFRRATSGITEELHIANPFGYTIVDISINRLLWLFNFYRPTRNDVVEFNRWKEEQELTTTKTIVETPFGKCYYNTIYNKYFADGMKAPKIPQRFCDREKVKREFAKETIVSHLLIFGLWILTDYFRYSDDGALEGSIYLAIASAFIKSAAKHANQVYFDNGQGSLNFTQRLLAETISEVCTVGLHRILFLPMGLRSTDSVNYFKSLFKSCVKYIAEFYIIGKKELMSFYSLINDQAKTIFKLLFRDYTKGLIFLLGSFDRGLSIAIVKSFTAFCCAVSIAVFNAIFEQADRYEMEALKLD